MQTLPAFLPVAQIAPAGNPVNEILEQFRQQSQVSPGTWALIFIVGQVIAILAILIASKAVVPDGYKGHIGNALRVWIGQWLVFIIAVVLVVVAMLALSAANSLHLAGVVVLVVGLITLFIIVRLPMKVYEIRFFRSIGLLILASVIAFIGNAALSLFFGPSPAEQWALLQKIQNLTPEQRTQLSEAFKKERQTAAATGQLLPGEKEAKDKTKSLQERARALETWYAELEKRRAAIPAGDEAATEAYNRLRARYEAVLDQLQAEAKAKEGTPR